MLPFFKGLDSVDQPTKRSKNHFAPELIYIMVLVVVCNSFGRSLFSLPFEIEKK